MSLKELTMTKKELKRLVNTSDIVKLYNSNLQFFVQVNKSKLLVSIKEDIHDDFTWSSHLFEQKEEHGKSTLYIY